MAAQATLCTRFMTTGRAFAGNNNSVQQPKVFTGTSLKQTPNAFKQTSKTRSPMKVSAVSTPEPKYTQDIFVDDAAMYASSGFPIAPEDLIQKTKTWLHDNNLINGFKEEDFADDFKFVAPVVGPLPKKEFISAVAGFDLKEGIPDLNPQYYNFYVDPFEPNRVWYTSRTSGTHTGVLAGAIQPTGTKIESPPQALSVTYNEEGLITKLTVGYVMDREIGNTGGLGAVFGILYAVGAGLPFPEAQPWQKSKRYALFQWLGSLRAKFAKKDE